MYSPYLSTPRIVIHFQGSSSNDVLQLCKLSHVLFVCGFEKTDKNNKATHPKYIVSFIISSTRNLNVLFLGISFFLKIVLVCIMHSYGKYQFHKTWHFITPKESLI